MNSEPFETPKDALELVELCIRENSADMEQMKDWFVSYAENHKTRIAFDFDMIRKRVSLNSTVVEVASIPFLLTIPLKKAGYHVIGVDIHPTRFQSTIHKFGLDVRQCDVEREPLPFPDNFCDVVLFNEFFEHLRINLIFTMRQVLRILKPGGLLFLSTPNLRSLHGIRNLLFYKRGQSGWWTIYDQYEKLETFGHMGHVREYTPTEVMEFLSKIGFVNETIIYRGTYESKFKRLITRLRPNLRPYFSCISQKP